MCASACSIAIRDLRLPTRPRFGMREGGSRAGRSPRAGLSGIPPSKLQASRLSRQSRAARRAAFTLSKGSGASSTARQASATLVT
jgi:hypothetical protein